MRVLHFYSVEDQMILQHVTMLQEGMGLEAENHLVDNAEDARTLLQGSHYDILHLHGCCKEATTISCTVTDVGAMLPEELSTWPCVKGVD